MQNPQPHLFAVVVQITKLGTTAPAPIEVNEMYTILKDLNIALKSYNLWLLTSAPRREMGKFGLTGRRARKPADPRAPPSLLGSRRPHFLSKPRGKVVIRLRVSIAHRVRLVIHSHPSGQTLRKACVDLLHEACVSRWHVGSRRAFSTSIHLDLPLSDLVRVGRDIHFLRGVALRSAHLLA